MFSKTLTSFSGADGDEWTSPRTDNAQLAHRPLNTLPGSLLFILVQIPTIPILPGSWFPKFVRFHYFPKFKKGAISRISVALETES